MQAQSTQEQTVFQPITLTLVLETKAEVKALATMCNYSPIVDAVRAAGLNLTPIFNMVKDGAYNNQTWDEDVALMAKKLSNHPALDRDDHTVEIVLEGTVEEQLDKIVDAFLTPIEEKATIGITCKAITTDDYNGTIEVSDGRQYAYKLEGCGEAISIKTMSGTPITEVPTAKYGTVVLQSADIEVIEAVLSQIS